MTEFTASNGVTIDVSDEQDRFIITNGQGTGDLWIDPQDYDALREYFQHEKDDRLGRWRWPSDPRFVVYPGYSPGEEERFVRVVEENTGVSKFVYESQKDGVRGHNVASDYFEAHPERKPWEEAKHNEIWVLFVAINEEAYRVDGESFVPVNSPGRVRIPLGDDRIRNARRIWPEDAS